MTSVQYHDEDVIPQLELIFYSFVQHSSWFIDLMDIAITASESIDITYAATPTIDGLDSAASLANISN